MNCNRVIRVTGLTMGLALVAIACGSPESVEEAEVNSTPTPSAPPSVVATHNVICDLALQIAGNAVNLTCLLTPGQDPHTYDVTTRDRAAIADADLVLFDGYNNSPELAQVIAASQNPAPDIAVFEQATPQPLFYGAGEDVHQHDEHEHDDEHEHGNEHEHDHSDGHDDEDEHDHSDEHDHDSHAEDSHHSEDEQHSHEEHHSEEEHSNEEHHSENGSIGFEIPDPHVWHSAANGAEITAVIGEQLMAIAPESANQIQAKTDELVADLNRIDTWISAQVNTIPEDSRLIVTPHNAYRYYGNRYGLQTLPLRVVGIEGSRPSARRLAEAIDAVAESNVPAVFAESTSNRDAMNTIARGSGAILPEQALFVDGPGGEGTPAINYQGMLESNTCTIVVGLGGTCTPLDDWQE